MPGVRLALSNDRSLHLGERCLVMGIVNCTPDSFYDGGCHADARAAIEAGRGMVEDGASIIDVGGESTRPGAQPVSVAAECERVLPVIAGLRQASAVAISIDTSKSEVARRALAAGADIVNDVTALQGDAEMAGVVARAGAPVILMHMQGTPATMQSDPSYTDVVGEVRQFLCERAAWAEGQGIGAQRIWIDPGFGFGKSLAHNASLLAHLERFKDLGYPVVVGLSRKSMIEHALGLPKAERLEASLALAVLAAERGAGVIRVHDVGPTVRAVRMAEAVLAHGGAPASLSLS